MKVLYDHQIFSVQIYGGISRYFYEIMNIFEKTKELEFNISIIHTKNMYIQNLNSLGFLKEFDERKYYLKNIYSILKTRNNSYLLNNNFSQLEISNNEYDIFHPTYYSPYFLENLERPFVLTVHDMIHEIYPELFPTSDTTTSMKKKLIENADEIICVSRNTKRDLLNIYSDLDESRIHVIYHGNSLNPDIYNTLPKEQIQHPIKRKYLLYVGLRKSYKNFNFFIQAMVKLLKKYPWLNIICIGGGEFSINEMQFFNQNGIKNRIYHYSVDDEHLVSFYKNALAFVFPSIYEGFGIPILEAFACKCPVICSNTSSLSEIAKDAAIYFNPKDILSIQSAVESVIIDSDLQLEMIRKGLDYLNIYSWEKAATLTKNVYKKALTR